jgi:hypothetical protein
MMGPSQFVSALCGLSFEDAFNPYANRCPIHDKIDAPQKRAKALTGMLSSAVSREVDSIWIGRDLGYLRATFSVRRRSRSPFSSYYYWRAIVRPTAMCEGYHALDWRSVTDFIGTTPATVPRRSICSAQRFIMARRSLRYSARLYAARTAFPGSWAS